MRATVRLLALFFVALFHCVGTDTLAFGIRSSRADMLGGALSLANPSATDFLSAPSLVGSDGALYFDAGVARRFELSELDVGFVALGYRRGDLLFALGVQQFGSSEFFVEQTARIALGYRFDTKWGGVSASATVSERRLEFGGGYQPLNVGAFGFGIGAHIDIVRLNVTVDNLNRPALTETSPEEPQELTFHAELAGKPSYTLSVRAHFEENSRPSFGLGQTVTLTDFAKLSWGIRSKPLIYGAGFEITKGRITFIYAGSFHTALGYSQSLTLSVLFSSAGDNEEANEN